MTTAAVPNPMQTTASGAPFASPQEMAALLKQQREAYNQDRMPDAKTRVSRLHCFKRLLLDNEQALLAAMKEDFSARSEVEMKLAEISGVIQNINYLSRRIKSWMKPEKRHLPLHMKPGKAQIVYQPLGVVGIMVPFNYPIFLAGSPLVTALAAGNRVMVKMPEATPNTSALFARLVTDYFPQNLVTVINGEANVAAEFSSLAFDHLLFTGAGSVAKHVMRAAANNLTPVTLELGGKSPVIVDRDIDIAEAAERICYGKSMNAGQTCVAPDYILVPEERIKEFADTYKKAFNRFYPSLNNNPDYSAVINDRHINRLQSWINDAKEKGATIQPLTEEKIDDGSRRCVPVLLTGVNDDMAIMQDEIFGPALPLVPYRTFEDAINYVNERPRPLALYYFGFNTANRERAINDTHSGGVAVNEVVLQVAVDDIPFGGIGPSGMGHYHGKEGFLTLSKAKSVLIKPKYNSMRRLYPPYNHKLLDFVFKLIMR
jgi:coniferyl-aldehyde dehydrogenase